MDGGLSISKLSNLNSQIQVKHSVTGTDILLLNVMRSDLKSQISNGWGLVIPLTIKSQFSKSGETKCYSTDILLLNVMWFDFKSQISIVEVTLLLSSWWLYKHCSNLNSQNCWSQLFVNWWGLVNPLALKSQFSNVGET
jgi:hypothetical protein